jgi:hypothetical protein
MYTTTTDTPMDVRRAIRKMRRLALAFHGSELRLLERAERCAKVVHVAPARTSDQKVSVQA